MISIFLLMTWMSAHAQLCSLSPTPVLDVMSSSCTLLPSQYQEMEAEIELFWLWYTVPDVTLDFAGNGTTTAWNHTNMSSVFAWGSYDITKSWWWFGWNWVSVSQNTLPTTWDGYIELTIWAPFSQVLINLTLQTPTTADNDFVSFNFNRAVWWRYNYALAWYAAWVGSRDSNLAEGDVFRIARVGTDYVRYKNSVEVFRTWAKKSGAPDACEMSNVCPVAGATPQVLHTSTIPAWNSLVWSEDVDPSNGLSWIVSVPVTVEWTYRAYYHDPIAWCYSNPSDEAVVVTGLTVCPCGNGIVDVGENCDDGNTNDGDGCSSLCVVENDWTCAWIFPSVCVEWTNIDGDGDIDVEDDDIDGDGIVNTDEMPRTACNIRYAQFDQNAGLDQDNRITTYADPIDVLRVGPWIDTVSYVGQTTMWWVDQSDLVWAIADGDYLNMRFSMKDPLPRQLFADTFEYWIKGWGDYVSTLRVSHDGFATFTDLWTDRPMPVTTHANRPRNVSFDDNVILLPGQQYDFRMYVYDSTNPAQTVFDDFKMQWCTSDADTTWVADYLEVTQVCGNWVVETDEACDDGNTNDWDGCNGMCIVECSTWQVPDGSGGCTDLLCDISAISVTKWWSTVSWTQLEAWDVVTVTCDGTYAELYAMRVRVIWDPTRTQFSRYTANNPVNYTIPTSDAYEFQCYLRASGDWSGSPWATEFCGEIETVYCGNWIVEWAEQCDSGAWNGTVCSTTYGNSCTYCSDTCQSILVSWWTCWDTIVNWPEECDGSAWCDNTICQIEYWLDDAPLHDTSKNFVITDLSPTLISWTSSQPNSQVAICFEDTTSTRDVFYTTTDAQWSFTYSPNLSTYASPWVNVWVMLHDADGLDIDHHAMMLIK